MSQSKIATFRVGSNIAFIKYWGVADATLNIPLNNSISMTLADAHTTTTVAWDSNNELGADQFEIDGTQFGGDGALRLVRQLDRIRAVAGVTWHARVASRNNFPMASGIASSASGFAALTVAGCYALGLDFTPTQLSALARRGSGSASRSLFGGFVEWEQGSDDASSVARQIFPPDHWQLFDIVAVVSGAAKSISSEAGHTLAKTSLLNNGRIESLPKALEETRFALETRDIQRLGPIIEQDALVMHSVMMTSTPSLLYWQAGTVEILQAVRRWREQEKIPVYFTIDAGPNVHLICEKDASEGVMDRLRNILTVKQIIISAPGSEPQQLTEHLIATL